MAIGERRLLQNTSGHCNHCGAPFHIEATIAIDAGRREDGAQILLPILPFFCSSCFMPITVVYITDHEVLRAYNYRWS